MENWILLSDLLSDPARDYNMTTQLFVDYKPDKKEVTFSKGETGCEFGQIAKTERLGWHPVKGEGEKVYLIAAKTTDFQLKLYGKVGRDSGDAIIQKHAEQLYSSKNIGAKGISIPFFDQLPDHLKKLKYSYFWLTYWLPWISYDGDDGIAFYGLTYAYGSEIKEAFLFSSGRDEFSRQFPLRPCVLLSANTLVNIGDENYNGKNRRSALKIKI